MHFMYVADAGRHLHNEEVYRTLCEKPLWARNSQIVHSPFTQLYNYNDPLYVLVRQPPVVITIRSILAHIPMKGEIRPQVPLSTQVMLHDIGFLTIRHSLHLDELNLDCLAVGRLAEANESKTDISSPIFGTLRSSLDDYTTKLFDSLDVLLDLKPRVPNRRRGELERVLVLRRLDDEHDTDYLLSHFPQDFTAMIARVKWREGQSNQFIQDMISEPLVLHKHLLVLCKWQGKLILYPENLPQEVRALWPETVLVNLFELLLVQFFALRMYSVSLDQGRSEAELTIRKLAMAETGLTDSSIRREATQSLLRVEGIRADVERSVHETQNSLVSLSYMVGKVLHRYDQVIRLTDRLEVVRMRLEDTARLNDVIVRTLVQQTDEALLEAGLKLQEASAREGKTLRALTWVLVVLTVVLVTLTVLAVKDLRDPVLSWFKNLLAA